MKIDEEFLYYDGLSIRVTTIEKELERQMEFERENARRKLEEERKRRMKIQGQKWIREEKTIKNRIKRMIKRILYLIKKGE